jgi:hypothetical protein
LGEGLGQNKVVVGRKAKAGEAKQGKGKTIIST